MRQKYMSSWGLAFAEEREMRKLEQMAAKGWHLKKFAPLGYTLVKGEPEDVQYSLDYRTRPDEDYFDLFASSGWQHVTSTGDEIHIFKGSRDAKPIYSDVETTEEKYHDMERQMGRAALILGILWVALFSLFQFDWPTVVETILIGVQLLVTIGLVFTGLPYIGYRFKRIKVNRQG